MPRSGVVTPACLSRLERDILRPVAPGSDIDDKQVSVSAVASQNTPARWNRERSASGERFVRDRGPWRESRPPRKRSGDPPIFGQPIELQMYLASIGT